MPKSGRSVEVIETEHYTKGNKPRDIKGVLEAIIVILTIILLVSIVIPTAKGFIAHEEGILALKEAKNISLAVRNSNYEYEAKGTSIVSKNQESGLSDDAMKDVMELAGATGKLEYIKFDESKGEVLRLRYRKKDMLVLYERSNSEKADGWNVYQLNDVITD